MPVFSDARLLELILDGQLKINPFVLDNIQPSSIDLCLDDLIKIPATGASLRMGDDSTELFTEQRIVGAYTLEPSQWILAQTHETIGIPRNCNGHIHNRSSLMRLGLDVATGSYINPGYEGKLPVSIKNNGSFSVEIVPFVRFCQLELSLVSPDPMRDYSQRRDAKYFGEKNSLVSLLHNDRELHEFRKKALTDENEHDLADFLQHRIEESSVDLFTNMPEDLKRQLGLL